MTVYPGASPEAVENEVTEVLEKEFSLIEGLTGIDSESHDGYSLIFLSMDWDTDLEAKKNDIRDRINNAEAELPDGLSGSPRLYDMGTSSVPVYTSLVESDLPEAELADRLENSIIPRFSRISDVSAVYSRGVESEALRIRLDPAKLESLDVTALEAWAAVSRGQGGVPSGHLLIGADRLAIQSEGEYRSVRQIRRQPVGYTAAGPTGLPRRCCGNLCRNGESRVPGFFFGRAYSRSRRDEASGRGHRVPGPGHPPAAG